MATKKTMKATKVGRNVEFEIEGQYVTLVIDLNAQTEPSKSGKTLIVATTGGNKPIGDGFVLGLNLYKYANEKKTR